PVDQAADLDLVHREHHARGGAGASQLTACRGDLGERQLRTTEPARYERRQRAVRAKHVERLDGEPPVAVDGGGVRPRLGGGGGDVLGQGSRRGLGAHAALSRAAMARAAAMAATLSNELRRSSSSGNSRSNSSSNASIRVTVAWEVSPAWNRSS